VVSIVGPLLGALLACAAWPGAAAAHGPVAPLASDFQARIAGAPAGLEAKVVDGDQRMWLRAPADATVVVLDYRGAPYLRFSPAGVAVNESSEMYYLNQTPVAETPPAGLTRTTPPRWHQVTAGHAYGWHDGRLHALATVALSPGASYVGRWVVPLRVGNRAGAVTGTLWHAGAPSIVWLWPIAVALLCLLAARRLRRAELDARLARALALVVLAAIATASIGRQLHGRPGISAFSVVELVVILALVAWALERVVRGRAGFLLYFVIAFVAIWEGITLLPTLFDGFVFMAVPAFVARTMTVLCLAGGGGLVLLAFRLAELPERLAARRDDNQEEMVGGEEDDALAGITR
jgi:hypothetical protein